MVALALSALLQVAAATPATGNATPVPAQSGYAATSSGSVTAPEGATITLRSVVAAPPVAFGTTSTRLPAAPHLGHRLRLVGEIRSVDAASGASLWLRVDGPTGVLVLDNGTSHAIKGTAAWTSFAVSATVPDNATTIIFGALLSGTGEMVARGVHLESIDLATLGPPTGDAARELDSAFAIVKRAAYWRDTVTWFAVEPMIRKMALGARSPSEAYSAISALLSALGDHHSFLSPPAATTALRTGGAQNQVPVVRALASGVGVVSVPGYSGSEASAMRTYASRMHDSLQKYMPQATCGWIVDLRNDTGGNMWSMLGGLKPFLGDETLGAFIGPGGQPSPWKAGLSGAEPPPSLAALSGTPVAVLTGPRTGSSGEAVAISFRGRPNTRTFGLPSAGLSTANSGFFLPDSAMIFLTTAIEADRTGRRYGGKLDPDEVIPAALAESSTDPQENAAAEWLRAQPSCKRG